MGPAPRPWLLAAALAASPAVASGQGLVVRDGTLGEGPLEVGPDPLDPATTYLITPQMGKQSGSNLFHSFDRFSIGQDETATFTGPDPIDGPQSVSNVISRVTGGDPSEIDGTLRSTIPGADVWLLNPSGVVFGEGAQLDVPGSFHASTGDYVGFQGGLERFYGDPSRASVLSTAPAEAFGFLGEHPPAPISLTGATLDLAVGETLELAGGDVTLTAATLDAPGGVISIRGGRIVVDEGSKVLAENAGEGAAGTITVAAKDSLLVDNSLLSVSTSSAGDAGTIELNGGELRFRNGPGLPHGFYGDPYDPTKVPAATSVGAAAETRGSGAGGAIEIDAESVTITDGAALSAATVGAVDAEGVRADASGKGGILDIEAGSVHLANRGFLSVSSWGSRGDAGAIDIRAGSLTLDALDPATGQHTYTAIDANSFAASGLYPGSETTEPENPGRAGTITIDAGLLEIKNGDDGGGHIAAWCARCEGGAGEIRIVADEMSVVGFVFAHSERGSSGPGGYIQIDADSVTVSEGGGINAGTSGSGDAGTITVEARTVAVEAGSHIDATSFTVPIGGAERGGDAGGIRLTATESITLTNEGGVRYSLTKGLDPFQSEPQVFTGIAAASVYGGEGGTILLDAPAITISRGASVTTATVGGGPGGTVDFTGEEIEIVHGGTVNSASLRIGEIVGGKAGDVTLTATQSIQVAGVDPAHPEDRSSVNSATVGSGPAGRVTLRAPRIVVEDGGQVSTTALRAVGFGGQGGARGDITLEDADQVIVRSGGRIDASSFVREPGGDIEVVARKSILVEGEGSGIGSRTGGPGDAGGVTLTAPRIEIAQDAEVAAQSQEGYEGLSNVFLESQGLIGRAPDFEGALSDGTPFVAGNAGAIKLEADEVLLSGGRVATNATDEDAADGGGIDIQARNLVHLDAGEITTSVNGGAGGKITIDPEVVILQNGSRIVARAAGGSGGNIQITTDNYFAFPDTEVSAEADRQELSGTVEVNTPDVNLAGQLTTLPSSYLDAASLMRERCAARRSGERAGSFAVRPYDGIPPEPDGWLPAAIAYETPRGGVGDASRTPRPARLASLPLPGSCP